MGENQGVRIVEMFSCGTIQIVKFLLAGDAQRPRVRRRVPAGSRWAGCAESSRFVFSGGWPHAAARALMRSGRKPDQWSGVTMTGACR